MEEGMLDTSNLIFIISQPRSGSTLLQSIVSNNEWVSTASEPWLLFHFLSYFNPHLVNAKYSNTLAYQATQDFFRKTGFEEDIKAEVKNFISRIYQNTLGQDKNIKYILDKTPRYYEIIDSIRDIFPTAKIIILKRNPLAVLSSIIETWHVKGINHLSPYRRDILNAPFLLQNFVEKNRNDCNVLVSSYEDITNDPRKEAERIYHWLDIEFKEMYLNYRSNNKYQGKYGDPTGIRQNNRPVKKAENWLHKLDDTYWKNFFIGYIHYLEDSFLDSYGYSDIKVKGQSTSIFETFLFINNQEIPDRPPIKKYLKYLRHRSAYKMYSRK